MASLLWASSRVHRAEQRLRWPPRRLMLLRARRRTVRRDRADRRPRLLRQLSVRSRLLQGSQEVLS